MNTRGNIKICVIPFDHRLKVTFVKLIFFPKTEFSTDHEILNFIIPLPRRIAIVRILAGWHLRSVKNHNSMSKFDQNNFQFFCKN